jgi:hypothetical protein
MESFRNILLSFTLGFGTISVLFDTNTDIILAKFKAVMVIAFISTLSLIYDSYKKSKKDLDN